MTRLSGYRRDGFTLIELLVVISIIGVLVALTTAGVMKGRDAVIRADNGWRMEQITVAANSFGVSAELSQPGHLPPPPFRLKKNYTLSDGSLDPTYTIEASYLKRLFPNLYLADTGLTDAVLDDGNQIAVFFLTGGAPMEFQGFARGQKPFTKKAQGDEQRIGPFLQLKLNMYETLANGHARVLDPYGSPYVVFLAGSKGTYTVAGSTTTVQTFTSGSVIVSPYYRQTLPLPATPPPPKYENPKTLQIISAGPNKTFGAGGIWSGPINGAGEDDKSNFSTAVIGAGPQ
ncbi:prepilin-type N-terminal cleavage/methylation domain-containing protein [Gemmata sp. G18]|uniref:Prepilin-type N-terminal cleavage/methylation domain-containing protein n=1 Tax=Gemmata palustris TaxID=2822762 RepID=A0ABS5BXM9_9BACT|nr:prepilin-type N-terminal cleavage/methylation domain-containing protein [Gemmata palustris]MBP3958491.1 prepilin-type N-terminal cleavage/methylation domain-containing protein [Gemmata palustris]